MRAVGANNLQNKLTWNTFILAESWDGLGLEGIVKGKMQSRPYYFVLAVEYCYRQVWYICFRRYIEIEYVLILIINISKRIQQIQKCLSNFDVLGKERNGQYWTRKFTQRSKVSQYRGSLCRNYALLWVSSRLLHWRTGISSSKGRRNVSVRLLVIELHC